MPASDFVKHRTGWTGAPVLQILQPLPDAIRGTGLRREVEEMLVGLGIL